WKAALKSAISRSLDEKVVELENRKLGDDEDPDKYYFNILYLCAQLDPGMTNEYKILYLKKCLPRAISSMMVGKTFVTLKDFKQVLRSICRDRKEFDLKGLDTDAIVKAICESVERK